MDRILIKKNNETGQALLFVVVAITISLAIGVSVSTRALNSSKRVARTDTSLRVNAAAEGGIESLLSKTDQELEAFIDSIAINNANCTDMGFETISDVDNRCQVTFPPSVDTGDNITARAIVWGEYFFSNGVDGADPIYWFNLDPGYVKEVNLDGYSNSSIKFCWTGDNSAIYTSYYDSTGKIKKAGFISVSASEIDSSDYEGFKILSESSNAYTGCDTLTFSFTPFGLRIKALFNSAQVTVWASGLPYQGYKLTSKGELVLGGDIKETKTITVYKSYPYASSILDYGLYSPNGPLE